VAPEDEVVRRLTALIIITALAWLVVGRFGTGPTGSTALALGLALIAASIVGWLLAFLRVPRVTGYLAFGLLCGPAVTNIMTATMARDLRAASGFAIALIAFIAGLQFPMMRSALSLRRVAAFSAATLAVSWLFFAAALFLAWPWLPIAPALAGAERLAAIALGATMLAAVSPTITVAVIADARASGPFAALATSAAVLIELGVIVVFTMALTAARTAFDTPGAGVGPALLSLIWTLGGSAAFGALLGALFVLYVQWIGRETTLVLLALCAVLAGVAAQLQLEPLVAGVVAGLVVQLVRNDVRIVLLDAIRDGATPIIVLFFAAIGASMNVDALAQMGALAIVAAIVRFAVIGGAASLASRAAGIEDSQARRRIWTALLPTSAVTLGFAYLVAGEHPAWGSALETLVIATVAIFELTGPVVLRAALAEAGEIGVATGGLVVVSNREPWIHEYAPDGSIVARPTPGGVSVALDALMRERGGVWVAHGAGTADRAVTDPGGSIDVPPASPAYRLRRVWLSQAEVDGYYAGFANGALWPLCHQAHVRPQFNADEWETYKSVNQKFADIVATEAPEDSSVFLNDYHLTLVAGYLRAKRARLKTALFWHIPWPDVDRLRICPWRRELLEGLLANDLLAFQLERDSKNFLAAANDELGASVSGETAFYGDRAVRVVNVPIGADYDRIAATLLDPDLTGRIEQLRSELGLQGKLIGLGVDRLDYTKGIPERLKAIERVLERMPSLVDRFAFVQIGVPSRGEVPAYAEISAEIDAEIERINSIYGRGPADGPIKYVKQSFQMPDLVALYRLARFCIVSSLHDGMNLVAKEFVAARDDSDGVLILSELAGAAQELHEALIFNPYDAQGFADAIARAIEMPPWERRRRMQALRRRVAGRDVLAWASGILDRLEQRKGQGFFSG
jgi:trehalose 6-phosphate synthase